MLGMNALQRLYRAWRIRPLATTLLLTFIPVGIVVLVEGNQVSRAFAAIGGVVIIHCIGALMVLGGISVAYSIIRKDPFYEVLGLTLAALGTGLYGTGLIIGLHSHGLVGGLGYLSMTVAFLGRVALLCRYAEIAAANE